jgi:hypothetical protein
MLQIKTLHIWILCLVLGPLAGAKANEPIGLSRQIDQLIRQLDDNSFRARQQASRKLTRIGEPALEALHNATKHPSVEVRHRAGTLIPLIQRFQLYTVSRDGRLFRLEIAKNHVTTKLIAKLGKPFHDRNVRTEGLAMAPDGTLYAAVVFVSESGTTSRLYRISACSNTATCIGEIAAAEVDGLDFGRDGKLYGAISSGSKTLALGLRQIVTINTATGHPSPTVNEVRFRDLDALAFDSNGRAFVTNGSKGLFSIDLTTKNKFAHVLTDPKFRRLLRVNDEMEGICITSEGAIFGMLNEERTFLARLDPNTGRVVKIGDLGFAALCLAANKNTTNTKTAQ